MKVTQNCWRSFARLQPKGEHLGRKGAITTSDVFSDTDQTFSFAVQSAFKRIRSWQVPPNWSRGDWFEELTAVGTAAAWQALCEFDPKRSVPLAGFGYCRVISRCLARYRKEWRYAVHLAPSDSYEKETTTFERVDLTDSSAANAEGKFCSNDHLLRGAIGALPTEQRSLIEQLFWEESTEAEAADTMHINQSTINRRKQAILKGLRRKLLDRNELQKFCIKLLVVVNLTNWCVGLPDIALGA